MASIQWVRSSPAQIDGRTDFPYGTVADMRLLISWLFTPNSTFKMPGEDNGVGQNCAQLQDAPNWGGRHNKGCDVQVGVSFWAKKCQKESDIHSTECEDGFSRMMVDCPVEQRR
jgi:hypothetical protein